MAKFITIGYGDQASYDRTAAPVRDAAHAHDARMRDAGVLMGIAGRPVSVRHHDANNLEVTTARFMNSALPVAGFAVLDADSIEEAIRMVASTPCAVAQGVVEVWPLLD